MRIIPAIDIINGKCVRLTKGDYSTEKIYREDPLDAAKEFEDAGINYLHLVDLDGAKSSRIINYDTLYKIATETNLKIDFGGGLKSDEDLRIAFENGASQITGGSIAVKNPDIFQSWIEKYGANRIILGADCKDRKIATQGWLESSSLEVVDFIQEYQKKGISYVICTDISKDGMLEGTSNELYHEILEKTQVKLIASGGVSSVEDLYRLKEMGCEGAIIGKAFYEGRISLEELSNF
ncbi:1-(5-phosphoribosyl)-5-[(5-phosphoribosylamino)methylideneamino]imidazole-4-carboxamide isomerase [Apibacter muscae]|uniref:1-(5-phosphoribosyl)-5-[(5-phosphoribosylamino)methylideneamino] imidazole-4-carboxamide isomerase n=1 Tax=Apibacter muscae TaxID=2509004 RepID=A0A563DFB7_9FLAO|nr:1-(5-phosphoribosyl)-5-[(5-phosphoribosylamino)methylideneamino]imidazole-4-carboxamide isomerase [Apibacter muscae]TWP28671.1 1-(5-phosphoribosyl)-5-[(5-phosphoribosylamino)methylideneamino]imidazole-4-carboxamide isomerase [Apibacter muscae]